MNPFGSISEWYKRWRHSRGFGVHSPFAYDLVKNAIAPGRDYSYYGYYDIDCAMLKTGADVDTHMRHDARLLLRLLVFLRTKNMLLYPGNQMVLVRTAKAAGVRCRELTKGSLTAATHETLIVIEGNTPLQEGIAEAIGRGAAVMTLDPDDKLRALIAGSMTNGLSMEGKRILIAIPRQQMAPTSYSMKF